MWWRWLIIIAVGLAFFSLCYCHFSHGRSKNIEDTALAFILCCAIAVGTSAISGAVIFSTFGFSGSESLTERKERQLEWYGEEVRV